ncbi:MAG: hypothetical protein ABMA64_00760 [Myxococcota bacterium]
MEPEVVSDLPSTRQDLGDCAFEGQDDLGAIDDQDEIGAARLGGRHVRLRLVEPPPDRAPVGVQDVQIERPVASVQPCGERGAREIHGSVAGVQRTGDRRIQDVPDGATLQPDRLGDREVDRRKPTTWGRPLRDRAPQGEPDSLRRRTRGEPPCLTDGLTGEEAEADLDDSLSAAREVLQPDQRVEDRDGPGLGV